MSTPRKNGEGEPEPHSVHAVGDVGGGGDELVPWGAVPCGHGEHEYSFINT